MQNVITSIIDTYGRERLSYGLIVYGNAPQIRVRFGDTFRDNEYLKSFIALLQPGDSGADLGRALQVANIWQRV